MQKSRCCRAGTAPAAAQNGGFSAGQTLPFGLSAIDHYLPQGGLPHGALHEVVPEESGTPAAFGFILALLARISSPYPTSMPAGARQRGPGGRREKLFLIMPAYGLREYGRPHGHGCNGLGLDPGCLILAETRHRNETLWAMEEALRSGAPAAVAGVIDKLDLKLSQRLHLAAMEAGTPASVPPAAGAVPGIERSGHALARRSRPGRTRPLRPHFARPRFVHLRLETLPQRTRGRMDSGVRSCHASFQSGCRAGQSCAFSPCKRRTPQTSRLILTNRSSSPLPPAAGRASPP